MSPADMGILVAAIAVVAGVIVWSIRRRRKGKSGCGGCANCPYASNCPEKSEDERP